MEVQSRKRKYCGHLISVETCLHRSYTGVSTVRDQKEDQGDGRLIIGVARGALGARAPQGREKMGVGRGKFTGESCNAPRGRAQQQEFNFFRRKLGRSGRWEWLI